MAKEKDKDKKNEKPKRGCLAQGFFLISAVSSLALAVAIVVMLLPQDLSDIEGYGEGSKNASLGERFLKLAEEGR